VIDWLRLLQRQPDGPDRTRRIDEAQQILRARLSYSGTTLKFSNEEGDSWWWLMDSADANAAKLILAEVDREHGQAAVERLIRDLRLEEIFGFAPGTEFKGSLTVKSKFS
jgi:hypothetical protein